MKRNKIKFCTFCICFIVAGIIRTSSEAAAQDVGCFRVVCDSSIFGPVFYGAQSDGFINVSNTENMPKTIAGINFTGGDSSEFNSAANLFPLTIPAHQTQQIALTFTPLVPKSDGSDDFIAKIALQSLDLPGGYSSEYDIHATAVRPTEFNTINPFDRTSILPTLKMSGTGDSFGQTFLFQSTDTIDLEVITISLGNEDVHFTVTPLGACSGLPMLAMPGELMAVRITFHASDSKMYYNQLRFVLGKGTAPLVYNLEAMRIIPQAGVQPPANPEIFTFSTIPNPSSGNIALEISGANKANIEIFDATGKLMISQKNISSWSWNGQRADGTAVPSGNYFIRASTVNTIGNIIFNTEQVAIVR